MNRKTISKKHVIPSILVAIIACIQFACPAARGAFIPASDDESLASCFVKSSGAAGGFCSLIGSTDSDLAVSFAMQGPFTVHCLVHGKKDCGEMRRAIRSRKLYGKVSVDTFNYDSLPYMQNLINIVIVESYPGLIRKNFKVSEVARILTPLGTSYIGTSTKTGDTSEWTRTLSNRLKSLGMTNISIVKKNGTWVKATKPWPGDIDEWTHYLHGADGNPVARDQVVAPPKHYQWTGGPLWMRSHESDSSISTIVTSRGRLFYIEDQAPISLVGNHPLPDKWFLVARDAFNGVFLWKIPIRRWGWREWKSSWFDTRPGDIPLNIQKRLVATGNDVYITLGYHAPVSRIDAKTGKILKTYEGTGATGEILYLDGKLILSVIRNGKLRIMTVDAATGKTIWISKKAYRGSTVDYIRWRAMRGSIKPPKLDPSVNMATDGKVIALLDGPYIVALDFKTGSEKWVTAFPQDKSDRNAGGMNSLGNLWIGTMIVKKGVVVHASPYVLAGFSTQTGSLLWTQPKKYIGHLWYEWKDVFVINGLVWTWGADLERSPLKGNGKKKQNSLYPKTVKGYDIKTGKLKRNVDLGFIFKTYHHHRCYRNKATTNYILSSRRGTEYVDLKNGHHTVHNWVRGTCHVGMMPANGLQYAPPHPCVCYINEKINGMNALAPAGSVKEEKKTSGETVLKKGPALQKDRAFGKSSTLQQNRAFGKSSALQKGRAFGKIKKSDAIPAKTGDWPAFRSNSQRTGSVQTDVSANLKLLWSKKTGTKPSPPIVVGRKVLVSIPDKHCVACLNTDDGRKLWDFIAGGRIDSPPTWHKGTVIFGSNDGWVYCLRAEDGALAWRFRAAPTVRLIGSFGQLESAWPVHGSVLVQNGVVYCEAGRSSELDGGIYLYGLDAVSGHLLYHNRLEGPDYKVEGLKQNYLLPMGTLPDVLMSDGDTIFMRTTPFDSKLNLKKNHAPSLVIKSGFLEDSYFKRTPWTFAGDYARLIVHDKQSVYYVRMFDSLQGLNPSVYFTPGDKGYLLFAKNMGSSKKSWMERLHIRIRAMVLCGEHLFVAGPPDIIDTRDPLGAFEGRKGGLLYAVDAAKGEKLSELKLTSPPVFNGAAAANGHLYIALENGTITCFGPK